MSFDEILDLTAVVFKFMDVRINNSNRALSGQKTSKNCDILQHRPHQSNRGCGRLGVQTAVAINSTGRKYKELLGVNLNTKRALHFRPA